MRSWGILSVLLVAVILVPFFAFEPSMSAWVDRLLAPDASRTAIAAAVALLLALDIFLPVPSSIVSTAAGALLGLGAGVAASFAGMTAGCIMGYAGGHRFGLPLVRRMVKERDVEQISAQFRRSAEWALATMRPVPVLAEASVLIAGLARVPFPRFLGITALANAGISVIYCAVGASALKTESFLLAFAGSIALPGCVMVVRSILSRRRLRVQTTAANPGAYGSEGSR